MIDHNPVESLRSQIRLRPRFRLEVPMSMEQIVSNIQQVLHKDGAQIKGEVMVGHATLKLPVEEKKIWSPRLTLTIEHLENEQSCLVRGMYSPDPGIWTLFMFLYTAIGFSIFILLMWGSFLYSLQNDSRGLFWWALGLTIVLILLWGIAQIGQKISKHQMHMLHREIETALNTEIR